MCVCVCVRVCFNEWHHNWLQCQILGLNLHFVRYLACIFNSCLVVIVIKRQRQCFDQKHLGNFKWNCLFIHDGDGINDDSDDDDDDDINDDYDNDDYDDIFLQLTLYRTTLYRQLTLHYFGLSQTSIWQELCR